MPPAGRSIIHINKVRCPHWRKYILDARKAGMSSGKLQRFCKGFANVKALQSEVKRVKPGFGRTDFEIFCKGVYMFCIFGQQAIKKLHKEKNSDKRNADNLRGHWRRHKSIRCGTPHPTTSSTAGYVQATRRCSLSRTVGWVY